MACDDLGRELPPNVFYDRGAYKYLQPNGKKKTLKNTLGKRAAYEEAVAFASVLNQHRSKAGPASNSLEHWRCEYVQWAQSRDPNLVGSASWKNRCNAMKKFAAQFETHRIPDLNVDLLRPWWDRMKYDEQHNRRYAFSCWFQWMLSKGLTTQNPFTLADDKPRLFEKAVPPKIRVPITLKHFRAIEEVAEPHVRIAMQLSLITMMREGDVVTLKFDQHVTPTSLRRANTKSIRQRGEGKGDLNEWLFEDYPALESVIKEARDLAGFCPFVVSSKKCRPGPKKEHQWQVPTDRLIKDFAKARDIVNWPVPSHRNPTTFHEIKGLAIQIYLEHNSLEVVSKGAGHTRTSVTEAYRAEHEQRYKPVRLKLDK